MADSFLILAQAAGAPSGMMNIVFIIGLFAIMYFMMIRPQQKQLKTHRELVAGLKKGDEVLTQGGLIGRIQTVSEREVTLEVANGVRIRVLKSSVAGRYSAAGESAPAAKTEDKKEEK
ncbi:preprotein translocase subunit YajC [Archangium lansingense]|uniref:Sec translocon accessory complex subunit YajC n=1 Tax=Archangium lansingense TaxID=2995310 RepID=A0ABT4ADG6_9BACT|nr:preprotein translocase subunit YajC [Archangium lansinium]MCY1079711.1 preprotein translocase subunit YajC [Archangium lansinium]